MFEDRKKGRELSKIVSYGYIIMGILLIIVTFFLNNETGAIALAERGANIVYLGLGSVLYFIFGAVVYYLSINYDDDDVLWKALIAIAILNFVIIGFSPILLAFSLVLVIAANDIRKELI